MRCFNYDWLCWNEMRIKTHESKDGAEDIEKLAEAVRITKKALELLPKGLRIPYDYIITGVGINTTPDKYQFIEGDRSSDPLIKQDVAMRVDRCQVSCSESIEFEDSGHSFSRCTFGSDSASLRIRYADKKVGDRHREDYFLFLFDDTTGRK